MEMAWFQEQKQETLRLTAEACRGLIRESFQNSSLPLISMDCAFASIRTEPKRSFCQRSRVPSNVVGIS